MNKAEMLQEPTDWSERYWDAIDDERFELQHCPDCDTWIHYPRTLCPECWNGDLAWREASGVGEVYSIATLHFSPIDAYEGEAPYAVAVIELAEGPKMMANVVNCDPEDVDIGDPVGITFEDRGERKVPQFEPR